MPALLTPRRFTVAEYYRMTEIGILGANERVELIEGGSSPWPRLAADTRRA